MAKRKKVERDYKRPDEPEIRRIYLQHPIALSLRAPKPESVSPEERERLNKMREYLGMEPE